MKNDPEAAAAAGETQVSCNYPLLVLILDSNDTNNMFRCQAGDTSLWCVSIFTG